MLSCPSSHHFVEHPCPVAAARALGCELKKPPGAPAHPGPAHWQVQWWWLPRKRNLRTKARPGLQRQ